MSTPFLFRNFTAAERKRNLIPFGYFSPNDSTAWIDSQDTGVILQMSGMTGTIDGVNAVFEVTVPYGNTCIVFKNGVEQTLNVMCTVSGQTVTFLDPYIPQTGDILEAAVS